MLTILGFNKLVRLTVFLILFVCTSAVAESHDVAIVAASEPSCISDVESKLEATGYFNTVDSIDVRVATPTLAQLEQYCAILVFTDSPIFDPVALGNVLADYVDRGGAVVTGMLANVDRPSAPLLLIQGRWKNENYWAIQPANFVIGTPGTMNNIHQPGHPILAGCHYF